MYEGGNGIEIRSRRDGIDSGRHRNNGSKGLHCASFHMALKFFHMCEIIINRHKHLQNKRLKLKFWSTYNRSTD